MKLSQILLSAAMLCTFQLSQKQVCAASHHHHHPSKSAKYIEAEAELEINPESDSENLIYFPSKINEDQDLYIVDVKNGMEEGVRYPLENCRYSPDKKEIYCEYLKKLNKYQYRITIPLINEPECEIKDQKEFTKAKLWTLEKDKFVFKPNNELYIYGKTKFYSNNLYSTERFQLWLEGEEEECMMKADFKDASISRIN